MFDSTTTLYGNGNKYKRCATVHVLTVLYLCPKMTEKLRSNKEKKQYKILLMDFMVWMQVEGERNKDLMGMSEAEVVDEYLNSNWFEIHNEVYINEKSE